MNLEKDRKIFDAGTILRGMRDGTELDKGVVLTERYLEEHYDELGDMLSFFTAYPDCFLDVIAPADSHFTLYFYQRITLRAVMRFKNVYITAPRAFSKSFITILGLMLQCIFIPGTRR